MMIGFLEELWRMFVKIVPNSTMSPCLPLKTAVMRGANGLINAATASLKKARLTLNKTPSTFLEDEVISMPTVRGLMETGRLVMKTVGLGIGPIARMMEAVDQGNGDLKVLEATGIVLLQALETVPKDILQPSPQKFSKIVLWIRTEESALVIDLLRYVSRILAKTFVVEWLFTCGCFFFLYRAMDLHQILHTHS